MINDWFSNWWREFEKRMIPFEVNWRGWQGKRTAFRIFCKLWALAHVELYANLLPQTRKRTGMQRVKTTNWRAREVRGGVEVGFKSGHQAWRRKRGRPPLSETEALRRLRDTIQRKRDKNKTETKHKDREPLPTVAPKTKSPRPTTGESFGKAAPYPQSKPGAQTVDSRKEKLGDDLLREIVRSIAGELGDMTEDIANRFIAHVGDLLGVARDVSDKQKIDSETSRWWTDVLR